jgi:hypothetical protein
MTSPPARSVGRTLTIVSTVGMVLTVVATALAFVLVGRLHRSVDDSLGVAVQTIDAVDESITVSKQVVDTISTALDGVAATLTTIGGSTATASDTLDTLDTFLKGSLTSSVVSIQQVLPTIQGVAGAIDTSLTAISKLPIGPDYQPAISFADSIQGLSDAITPLPGDIDSLATNVADLQTSVASVSTDLSQLVGTVTSLQGDIKAIKDALDQYLPVAANAREVALHNRDRLRADTTLGRVLVILVGLVLILTQAATGWVGRLLVERETSVSTTTSESESADVLEI